MERKVFGFLFAVLVIFGLSFSIYAANGFPLDGNFRIIANNIDNNNQNWDNFKVASFVFSKSIDTNSLMGEKVVSVKKSSLGGSEYSYVNEVVLSVSGFHNEILNVSVPDSWEKGKYKIVFANLKSKNNKELDLSKNSSFSFEIKKDRGSRCEKWTGGYSSKDISCSTLLQVYTWYSGYQKYYSGVVLTGSDEYYQVITPDSQLLFGSGLRYLKSNSPVAYLYTFPFSRDQATQLNPITQRCDYQCKNWYTYGAGFTGEDAKIKYCGLNCANSRKNHGQSRTGALTTGQSTWTTYQCDNWEKKIKECGMCKEGYTPKGETCECKANTCEGDFPTKGTGWVLSGSSNYTDPSAKTWTFVDYKSNKEDTEEGQGLTSCQWTCKKWYEPIYELNKWMCTSNDEWISAGKANEKSKAIGCRKKEKKEDKKVCAEVGYHWNEDTGKCERNPTNFKCKREWLVDNAKFYPVRPDKRLDTVNYYGKWEWDSWKYYFRNISLDSYPKCLQLCKSWYTPIGGRGPGNKLYPTKCEKKEDTEVLMCTAEWEWKEVK